MTSNKSRKSAAKAAKGQARSDAEDSAPASAKADPKASAIIALLKRDGGATLEEMMEATGWQKHSVRGFMAGALKKRHGLAAISTKADRGRSYRVADEAR